MARSISVVIGMHGNKGVILEPIDCSDTPGAHGSSGNASRLRVGTRSVRLGYA